MKTIKLYLIAALLGTTLVGCQKVAEIQTPEEPQDNAKTWTLTVKAVKSPMTRALELDGKTLNAKWNTGEIVAVYYGGTLLGTVAVTAVDDNTGIATLSGTISSDGVDDNGTLTLIYPGREDEAWTYLGQGGEAPALEGELNQFDYATASLAVADLDLTSTPIVMSSDAVEFTNEQSIYCFGFKEGTTVISAKSFLLSSSLGELVRSRSLNGGKWASEYGIITLNVKPSISGTEYYMAVRNENTSASDTYTFNVVGSDDALYSGTKVIPGDYLEMGQYLAARSIKVTKKAFTPENSGEVTDTGVL